MDEQEDTNLPEPNPKLIAQPKSKRPLGLTLAAIWLGLSMLMVIGRIHREFGPDWSHFSWNGHNAFETISMLVMGLMVTLAFIGVLSREKWGWFAVMNNSIAAIINTIVVLFPIFMEIPIDTEAHQIYRFPKVLIIKTIVLVAITIYLFRSNVISYFQLQGIKRTYLALAAMAMLFLWSLTVGFLIVFKMAG